MKQLAFLLCLSAPFALPSIAQNTDEPNSDADAAVIHPRHHTVPRSLRPHEEVYDFAEQVTVSYNTGWAGYAVTGSAFTYVQGSWIVSAVNCTATPNTDSSEWVGIDGWTSDTVEQVGTDADCHGKTPYYYVWYEFYPLNTVVIDSVSIAAGDKFTASVTYDGDDAYTVAITNESTGQSFSKEVKFSGAYGSGAPPRTSAEWIMEMDGNRLSDFGVDSFGTDYTGYANNTATDSSISNEVISAYGDAVQKSITTKTGTSSSKVTARPSSLASDGASFTATWKSE